MAACRYGNLTDGLFPLSWYRGVCARQVRQSKAILNAHTWPKLKQKGLDRRLCQAILVEPSKHFQNVVRQLRIDYPLVSGDGARAQRNLPV